MRIELHVLQNFAPSNLNRDDTGAPKDCEFGGYRRARISSQAQKRAVRELFRLNSRLAPDEIGVRTKRIVDAVAHEMNTAFGMDREAAANLAMTAIEGAGLGRNRKGENEDAWKTEYLLFVPRRIIAALAALLNSNRSALEGLATATASHDSEPGREKGRKAKKDSKKEARAAYPKEIRERLEALLEDARGTVDLALFGRMIADKPAWNVTAACQVAHAISTNRVQMDFDFFTAVDDLKPDDTAGSDMMGTVQFNSSCFYRYAVLDVDAARINLDQGEDTASTLLTRSVEAFVRAFIAAIPTGKQNSMAAHNFPSYVLGVARNRGQPVSLANAFLKPARPGMRDGMELDLVDDSVDKLETYYQRMRDVFGPGPRFAVSWADRSLSTSADSPVRSPSLDQLVTSLVSHAVPVPGASD